jgi:Txe/YoeB family toxin of Txe-Axe toxin-antitoxin module
MTSPTNDQLMVYGIPVYVIMTISATLLAAFIAQILSHFFTIRRERSKDFMQKYQELYSAILVPASIYMFIKTNPRKIHDVHPHVKECELLENIINKIIEEIKFASSPMIQVYERLQGYKYFEDGWGSRMEIEKHALIYLLLDDIQKNSKFTGAFNKEDKKRLKEQKYYYGICTAALHFFDMDDTEQILQLENFSGLKKKLKIINFKSELLSHNRLKLSKILMRHIGSVNNQDRKFYEHLLERLRSQEKI